MARAIPTPTPSKIDWVNLITIAVAHLLAIFAVVYMAVFHFSWWTVGLGVLWYTLCGLSITGGYHRLFAHPTYKACAAVKAVFLLWGAASVQNSALKWSEAHRCHHAKTDREEDPYNIQKGFWWAHIGWVFFKIGNFTGKGVKDLYADPMLRFQDRYYVPIAVVIGLIVPAALGLLWGDVIGAVLVAGFLRLVLQWHSTFSVNSFAHLIGSRPYDKKSSARNSFWVALMTMGEGYHNFHHRFQTDYRNGIRWWQFDPTKWFVWSGSKLGLTRDLRRTPNHLIQRARESQLISNPQS